MFKYDIGFIGYGNMAGAIADRLAFKNPKLKLAAADISFEGKNLSEKVAKLDNITLAKECGTVFLSVKPIHAADILREINPYLQKASLVISILAGVKINALQALAPNAQAIARAMPNLAAKIGNSISGVCFSDTVDKRQKDFVLGIFACAGDCLEVKEGDLDAVTAVSGSGLAYVYSFADSLIKGGIECGLDEQASRRFALQTIRGAVEMLKISDTPIEDMIDAVCSKGGTTIEAINVLNDNNFSGIISDAIKAAYEKSKVLSDNFK